MGPDGTSAGQQGILQAGSSFCSPSPLAEDGGPGPIEAVIFEGGGTKGMVYAGCIARLEEENVLKHVKFFAGTSAGSQTAALFAAGYSGTELRDIMGRAPWKKLLDGNEGCCGCMTGFHRLRTRKGYYKGDFLEEYLDDLFEKKLGKKKITFKQFHDDTGKSLRLGVCNINTRKFEFLDHMSKPNMAISEACRASSSIPFVFVPKVINGVHYVDGGLEGNLPATAFGPKNGLAFHLMSGTKYEQAVENEEQPPPAKPPSGFFGFTEVVVDMLMNKTDAESAEGIEEARSINANAMKRGGMKVIKINCGDHGVLETSMTEEQIAGMIKAGSDAANNFIDDLKEGQ